mmetsp:Transcript_47750/g.132586  ORF Transcript_47750/g.132586 Transcript_47750/m.132586 type:complete len:1277 (+) Transcript_47750:1600-5430(+)
MEAYVWLPPGCFPDQTEAVFRWAVNTFRGQVGMGDNNESSLLETLVNPDDDPLGVMSPYYCQSNGALDAGSLDDIVALQVHLTGAPLDSIERELAVYSPTWEGPDAGPPTPLHGARWRRPPPPSARIDVRLLDASILLMAATFSYQDHHDQSAAIEMLAGLLAEKSGKAGLMASDEEKRRKERAQRAISLNVVTALLAVLKTLAPYSESEYNLDVPWVKALHQVLLSLLRATDDAVRRAAAEGLALLATKMGTVFQAQLMQQLVEFLRAQDVRKGGESGTAARGGAMFALACLKRAAPAIETGGFWGELEGQLAMADMPPPQPLRTWGLHALTIVARSINPGLTNEARVRSVLAQMIGLLEAHFLGPWSPPGSVGSVHEPAMLLCLAQLTNAMMALMRTLEPSQALVSRFLAVCHGVTDQLAHYEDPRIVCECLRTMELLGNMYPNLTSMDRVEWLGVLNALVDMPDLTSPACLRKAIQVLQGMVSMEPAFIGKYELHSTFFTSMAYAYGAATCPRAPVWRGLAVSRRAEFHYQNRNRSAGALADALESSCVGDCEQCGPARVVHWLLLSRTIIVGGGSGAAAVAGPTEGGDGGDGDKGSDDEGEAEARAAAGAPITDLKSLYNASKQSAAASAGRITTGGALQLRWQVKCAAARFALAALRVAQGDSTHSDVAAARAAVNGAIVDAGGSVPLDAAGSLPDFVSLHIDTVVGTACSASTYTLGDEHGVPTLQQAGLKLLSCVVESLSGTTDPDSEAEGTTESILTQFTSQITSAFRPALANIVMPQLLAAGCDVFVVATAKGLVVDIGRLKRLVKSLIPSNLNAETLKPTPDPNIAQHLLLRGHVVRLLALAKLLLLTDVVDKEAGQPVVSAPVRESIRGMLSTAAAPLRAHWGAVVADAVRLLQGHGGWPAAEVVVKRRGLLYDSASDLGDTHGLMTTDWTLAAAAAASLSQEVGRVWDSAPMVRGACLCYLVCGAEGVEANFVRTQGASNIFGPSELCLKALTIMLFSANPSQPTQLSPGTLASLLQSVATSALAPQTPSAVKASALGLLRALTHTAAGTAWLASATSEPDKTTEPGEVAGYESPDENAPQGVWRLLVHAATIPLLQLLPAVFPEESRPKPVTPANAGPPELSGAGAEYLVNHTLVVLERLPALCPAHEQATTLPALLALLLRMLAMPNGFVSLQANRAVQVLQSQGLLALSTICTAIAASSMRPATITSLLESASLTTADAVNAAAGGSGESESETTAMMWLRAYLVVAVSSNTNTRRQLTVI